MARSVIRQATLRDPDVLVRHRRRMWEDMGHEDPAALDRHDRAYRTWAKKGIRAGRFVGFIVEKGAGVAVASGCIWLMPEQPHPDHRRQSVPYLLSMFTEPADRGKGHAARIVQRLVEWSRKGGYEIIRLHASPMGRGVYAREGFERTWEMRRPVVTLRKDVCEPSNAQAVPGRRRRRRACPRE